MLVVSMPATVVRQLDQQEVTTSPRFQQRLFCFLIIIEGAFCAFIRQHWRGNEGGKIGGMTCNEGLQPDTNHLHVWSAPHVLRTLAAEHKIARFTEVMLTVI